jgi:hypothetical protein
VYFVYGPPYRDRKLCLCAFRAPLQWIFGARKSQVDKEKEGRIEGVHHGKSKDP